MHAPTDEQAAFRKAAVELLGLLGASSNQLPALDVEKLQRSKVQHWTAEKPGQPGFLYWRSAKP